jgi:two-component system uhpT operon response regulator UhpA
MIRLSPREHQVCDLMVQGLRAREIGRSLGISSRTVEDHRMHIMKKYQVRNVVQLVRAVYGIGEATE